MTGKIKRPNVEAEGMDLKCIITLMLVLIPVLMVSAEFARVAVVDINLPGPRGCVGNPPQSELPEVDRGYKLYLTAIVTDSGITLGARGGFMPSLSYREFHRYVSKDGGIDTLVEYLPGKQPINQRTGREFTIQERFEIYLFTTDENRDLIRCQYTKFGEMLTNADGFAVKNVNAGDTVFALGNPRRRIIVSDPEKEFESRPLSAYDELKNRLMKVKERYSDADDVYNIVIAAEDEVIYDKIIQMMDAARTAEFSNISIAKLRV